MRPPSRCSGPARFRLMPASLDAAKSSSLTNRTPRSRSGRIPRVKGSYMDRTTVTATIADHDAQQVERAKAMGLRPVVLVHGLWLLSSSWDRWTEAFEDAEFDVSVRDFPERGARLARRGLSISGICEG